MNNLDSLYASYYEEYENKYSVFIPNIGFANYSIEDKNSIYIQEVYVVKNKRREGISGTLQKMCVEDAREKGLEVRYIYTSTATNSNTTKASLDVIEAYGYTTFNIDNTNNIIYFKKEIE